MSGVISSGQGYEANAIKGMTRLSELEQQRISANKQIENEQTSQYIQAGTSLGILAYLGYAAMAA